MALDRFLHRPPPSCPNVRRGSTRDSPPQRDESKRPFDRAGRHPYTAGVAGPEGASEVDAGSNTPGGSTPGGNGDAASSASAGNAPGNGAAGPPKRSGLGVIIHSFFVVPLLIAVLAVLVIAGVSILSSEPADALDYLADVRVGGQTRRWQAAFDLSTLLFDLQRTGDVPTDQRFVDQMNLAFAEAAGDDPRVRQYLSQAMALTGDRRFVVTLLDALAAEESELSASFFLHALGFLAGAGELPALLPYLRHESARIRTSAVRTIGAVGDPSTVPALEPLLFDEEPNVRWFAAIALAGLGSGAGAEVLMQLLDREYLAGFPNVDADEQSDIMEVAVTAAAGLGGPQLIERVRGLASGDVDPRVRRAAAEALR